MGDPTKKMQCGRHGEGYASFVCQHLVRGSHLGFFHADTEHDPRPDAWCGDCDAVLMQHGGEWNDESEAFAGVTVVCSGCYDEIRERNKA